MKIHDDEWLIGTMNPDDLTYIEKDGKQVDRSKTGESICVPVAEYTGQPVRFILDTGCGHDLVSRSKVESMGGVLSHDDQGGMSFMTANGVTQTQEVMNFKPRELDQESRAYTCWKRRLRCYQWERSAWSRDIPSFGCLDAILT